MFEDDYMEAKFKDENEEKEIKQKYLKNNTCPNCGFVCDEQFFNETNGTYECPDCGQSWNSFKMSTELHEYLMKQMTVLIKKEGTN